jgi:hypothetical protein
MSFLRRTRDFGGLIYLARAEKAYDDGIISFSRVFLQSGLRFSGFEAIACLLDDRVAEHDGIEQAFDVSDSFFREWSAKLVGKAPAINRQNLNEMNLPCIVNMLHVNVEECVLNRVDGHLR